MYIVFVSEPSRRGENMIHQIEKQLMFVLSGANSFASNVELADGAEYLYHLDCGVAAHSCFYSS